MFCYLKYTIDKEFHRNYFWETYSAGRYHTVKDPMTSSVTVHKFWWQVFNLKEVTKNIINDLGLVGKNILPRYSHIKQGHGLRTHVDIDKIVGINFNLMEEYQPSLTIKNQKIFYESLLVDVGAVPHSVEKVNYDRLVLKLAIREPFNDIMEILDKKGLIDVQTTLIHNPNYDTYISKN